MKITELLDLNGIELNVSVSSKDEAINKLIDLMCATGKISDKDAYKEGILAREALTSTGIGEGIAIPHAQVAAVKAPGLAAMTVPDGVDYESLDGQPAHLFFMIAAPADGGSTHLQALAKLSALLMDEGFRKDLLNAKNDIVNVRSEVANGSVQQVQTVLHTGFFQARAGGRIELRALAAVAQIDGINIFHEFRGSLFADVLVERAAEIVGDVVLAVGECARAAKAAHDGAALAVDAGFHFLAVNRTLPAVERVSRFKNGDFQVRPAFHQFISGKNSSGASTNN